MSVRASWWGAWVLLGARIASAQPREADPCSPSLTRLQIRCDRFDSLVLDRAPAFLPGTTVDLRVPLLGSDRLSLSFDAGSALGFGMVARTLTGHAGVAVRWRFADRHRLTLFAGGAFDVRRDDVGSSTERAASGLELRYDGDLGDDWSVFGGVSQFGQDERRVSGGVAWRFARRWRLALEGTRASETVSTWLSVIGAW